MSHYDCVKMEISLPTGFSDDMFPIRYSQGKNFNGGGPENILIDNLYNNMFSDSITKIRYNEQKNYEQIEIANLPKPTG